jgi:hypothetical protein
MSFVVIKFTRFDFTPIGCGMTNTAFHLKSFTVRGFNG